MPDVIRSAVRSIQSKSRRPRQPAYWEKVNRELGAYFAELNISSFSRGASPRSNIPGSAKIAKAKKLLTAANAGLERARKLPELVETLGVQVFGTPFLSPPAYEALKAFEAALSPIAEHLTKLECGLHFAIAARRSTKGSRATVLERATGTPTVRFLQRLILLWRQATEQPRLGTAFETVARNLILAALGECPDDLRRQIQQAKNLGAAVATQWTLKTDIENLPLDTLGPRGKKRGR